MQQRGGCKRREGAGTIHASPEEVCVCYRLKIYHHRSQECGGFRLSIYPNSHLLSGKNIYHRIDIMNVGGRNLSILQTKDGWSCRHHLLVLISLVHILTSLNMITLHLAAMMMMMMLRSKVIAAVIMLNPFCTHTHTSLSIIKLALAFWLWWWCLSQQL